MTRLEKTFRALSDLYDFYQKIKNRKIAVVDDAKGAGQAEKERDRRLVPNQPGQASS